MRNATLTAIAAVCLALSGPAFAQGSHPGMHGGAGQGQMGHEMMKSSPGAARAAFDHQFIDTMVVHHQGAIDMARLAEERAEHDELRQMARMVIEDQQKEIRQLQDWKKEWFADKGDAVNMSMRGMAESMKDMPMDKLASAKGAAFDAMFIDMMIRHHEGAIKMAETARQKSRRPEIKRISQEIIREQKKEMAQMAAWKKAWKL